MAKEMELKYGLENEGALLRVLNSETVSACRVSDWEEAPMRTAYYDMPSGCLSSRHWTLRHRMEDGRGVACLKTPTEDPNARNEYEVASPSMGLEAMQALVRAGAPEELLELADAKELCQTCGAEFRRRMAMLRLPDGTMAQICGDVGRVFSGEREEPLCEMEVELKSGSERSIRAFCGMLVREFGLSAQSKSKYARARALME